MRGIFGNVWFFSEIFRFLICHWSIFGRRAEKLAFRESGTSGQVSFFRDSRLEK